MTTENKNHWSAGSQGGSTKYSRNNKTISGRLHDEMVMMDIDQGKYFSLNPVATRIWEMLEKELSIDEICSQLADEYDVETVQCRTETEELLGQMERMGLVRRAES